jgi:hypothetical protein
MSKQDRQGARTPADLEQKYQFGKTFAEILGVALDAQKSVEESEALLSAELSLKLGRNEYDEVVSMLNASASVITLTSNRLVIESDKFSLSEDGTVSMRFSDKDAEDSYLLNTETHYLKLPEFEVLKTKTNETYTRMKSAKIGTAFFGTSNVAIVPQVRFEDEGIILTEKANLPTHRSCFVWENNDGTKLYRLRGGENGIVLEGLSKADGSLDFRAFGISLRSLLNRLEAVENALNVQPEEHEHDYVVTEQKEGCAVYYEYTCDCGHSYTSETIRYEHDFFEGQCTICGETDPDYTECDHPNMVTDNYEPSCTENGINQGYCPDCGDEYYEIVPATGHDWELTDDYGGGQRIYTCRECGETMSEGI